MTKYTKLGSSCIWMLYFSRRPANSSSSFGGSKSIPEGTGRDGSEVLLLVDVDYFVRTDWLALLPNLFKQLIIAGHSGQCLDLVSSQLMFGRLERLVIHEDIKIWHESLWGESGGRVLGWEREGKTSP